MLTNHASDIHSLTLVPLYDTLGPEAVQFIVNQAELKVVVCSGDKVKPVRSLFTSFVGNLYLFISCSCLIQPRT